jgi:hypothetical protein
VAEIDRIKGLLTDQVAGDVAGDITAIGYFFREDAANDSYKHGPRFLRRVFAKRDDHIEDRLGSMNLIVLTPTQVHIYAGRAKAPWLQVTGKLGAWPVQDVRMEMRAHTASSYAQRQGGTTRTRMKRVTLTFADGTAPLTIDFRSDALGRECTEALEAALA